MSGGGTQIHSPGPGRSSDRIPAAYPFGHGGIHRAGPTVRSPGNCRRPLSALEAPYLWGGSLHLADLFSLRPSVGSVRIARRARVGAALRCAGGGVRSLRLLPTGSEIELLAVSPGGMVLPTHGMVRPFPRLPDRYSGHLAALDLPGSRPCHPGKALCSPCAGAPDWPRDRLRQHRHRGSGAAGFWPLRRVACVGRPPPALSSLPCRQGRTAACARLGRGISPRGTSHSVLAGVRQDQFPTLSARKRFRGAPASGNPCLAATGAPGHVWHLRREGHLSPARASRGQST